MDKLAVGGMAEIYLAKAVGEAGFEKICVIKRIHPHLSDSEGFINMFLDEARLAARLNHPGIVQLFDFGRHGSDYFFAMEYLAGEDVSSILRKSTQKELDIPVEVVAKIAALAADALHFAHEFRAEDGHPLGIVHRDISPANLFVTYQGSVKILDFGIARSDRRLQNTLSGELKGKAAYMPPEQILGKNIDRRADLWSLGVCLYEMLTRRRLFSRSALPITLAAVQTDPIPSPRLVRPEIPEELDAVVMKALEREQAKRFQTAEEMREALDRFLADRTYVPQSVQLGQYLRNLFGAERADQRLRRAFSSPSAVPSPFTGDSLGSAGPRSQLTGSITHPSDSGGDSEDKLLDEYPLDMPNLSVPGAPLAQSKGAFVTPPAEAVKPTPKKRRVVPIALAVAIAAALVGGAVWFQRRPPDRFVLEIESTPPGAEIYLDGQKRPEQTPARIGELSAGTYQVRLWLDGHQSFREDVTVNAERQVGKLSATLVSDAPPTASLELTSEPPGAKVAIDGKETDQVTPVVLRSLAPGEHRVQLTKPGFKPYAAEVTLEAGKSQPLEKVILTPEGLAPEAPKKGFVTVEANVPGKVFVDGVAAGPAPVSRFAVSPGTHELRFEGAAPGVARTTRVEVKAGEETKVPWTFGKGRLKIDADPWADVWLDGVKIGQTPLGSVEVAEGRHTLRLVNPDGEKTLPVNVRTGATQVIKEKVP
jgi:serine/threonine-protein kinase